MTTSELLHKTLLFKGSSIEELSFAGNLFQERRIKPNAMIFMEKMPGEALFIIKNGTVKITMMAGEGEEVGLLLLGPGEFFGELALVHNDVRLVSARAETDVELLTLTRKYFQVLVDKAPHTAARVLIAITKLLAMRVKAYSEKLKDFLRS